MEGLSTAKRKLLAIDCLKALKEERTFRSLSRELKLPIGVINRYVNGYVLPREERAQEIIDYFYQTYFDKMIDEMSLLPENKYRVTISILTNNFLLALIAHKASGLFEPNVDKVLTAASDGIALAIKMADAFGCRAVYAKNSQEITKGNLLASRTAGAMPRTMPLFLPENLLGKSDHVLIVDDVIRSGSTVSALRDLCEQTRSRVAGVFAIFMTEEALAALREQFTCPVHAIRVIRD
ncbi:hypothetical protein J4439_00685 [Candidatus Woesearchaeota archaeon]|nr:hypothetical protein [Candidatus Woesearchaeota archaeon]